jgi:hypothetical protein
MHIVQLLYKYGDHIFYFLMSYGGKKHSQPMTRQPHKPYSITFGIEHYLYILQHCKCFKFLSLFSDELW